MRETSVTAPRSSMSEARGIETYRLLTSELRELALFSSSASVLGWDQETMMPPRAGELSAEQFAALGGLVHQRHTRAEVGDWLAACEAEGKRMAEQLLANTVIESYRVEVG